MLTEEQWRILARDPDELLSSYRTTQALIKQKLEDIQHLHDLTQHITQELSPVATFGSFPTSRIETCCVEIAAIDDEIGELKSRMRLQKQMALDIIDLLDSPRERVIIEAHYVDGQSLNHIAHLLDQRLTYRRVCQIKQEILEKLSAKGLHFLSNCDNI